MSIVDTIKFVAQFADKGNESIDEWWQQVHFKKGECYAQTSHGGVCSPIDLSIQCGVNAQKLLKALKAVKGAISIKKDGQIITIAGDGCSAKLKSFPQASGPKFYYPGKDKKAWKETDLLDQVKRISWCVCNDPGRAYLSGIYFSDDGFWAINGHALAHVSGDDFVSKLGTEMIIPPSLLMGLPNACWITKEENRLFVATDKSCKAFRVINSINAQFPPVSQLSDAASKQPGFRVSRSLFLDAVKRASVADSNLILEVSKTNLRVVVDENSVASLFSFVDSVPISENEGVAAGRIIIDAKYLKSALDSASSEEITIRTTPDPKGGTDPFYIEDDIYSAVVMPRRM